MGIRSLLTSLFLGLIDGLVTTLGIPYYYNPNR